MSREQGVGAAQRGLQVLGVVASGQRGQVRGLGGEEPQLHGKEGKPWLTGHDKAERPGVLAGAPGDRGWAERQDSRLGDAGVQGSRGGHKVRVFHVVRRVSALGRRGGKGSSWEGWLSAGRSGVPTCPCERTF